MGVADGQKTQPDTIGPYLLVRTESEVGRSATCIAQRQGDDSPHHRIHLCRLLDHARRAALASSYLWSTTIRHERLVPALDSGVDGDSVYVALPADPGAPLVGLSRSKNGPIAMAADIVTSMGVDVAVGLHTGHEHERRGFVHHALSPASLFVDRFGRAVVDGVFVDPAIIAELHASGGPAILTPDHASGAIDRRSDVYVLGVMLWTLLTGRSVFGGAALEPPSRFARNVPPALDAAVMAALDLNPSQRPATAMDLAAKLLAAVDTAGAREKLMHLARAYEPDPATAMRKAFQRTQPLAQVGVPPAPPTVPHAIPIAPPTVPQAVPRPAVAARSGPSPRGNTERPISTRAPSTRPPATGGPSKPAAAKVQRIADPDTFEESDQTIVEKMPLFDTDDESASKGRSHLRREPDPIQPYEDPGAGFTVYRPAIVEPLRWYKVLAFAHRGQPPSHTPDGPHPLAEVARLAKLALGTAGEDDQRDEEDGPLAFVPCVPGVEFSPARRSFAWGSSVHMESFNMRAHGHLDGRTVRGTMSVYLGRLLLGEVTMSIRVDATRSDPQAGQTTADTGRRFRKFFGSWVRADAVIGDDLDRFQSAFDGEFLRDVRVARSNGWSARVGQLIERADVFQLFWSSASMRAEDARKEWEHALSLGRADFVRPSYWDEPLPSSPSEDLPPPGLVAARFQKIQPLDGSAWQPAKERNQEPALEATPIAPPLSAEDAAAAGTVESITARGQVMYEEDDATTVMAARERQSLLERETLRRHDLRARGENPRMDSGPPSRRGFGADRSSNQDPQPRVTPPPMPMQQPSAPSADAADIRRGPVVAASALNIGAGLPSLVSSSMDFPPSADSSPDTPPPSGYPSSIPGPIIPLQGAVAMPAIPPTPLAPTQPASAQKRSMDFAKTTMASARVAEAKRKSSVRTILLVLLCLTVAATVAAIVIAFAR